MPSNKNIKIPESLPKCALINILAEKAHERTDTDFNFLLELERFRRHVKEDADNIKLLFAEYTPHDEQFHLRPLFHIASNVLQRKLLQRLNVTELFLLSSALYGHDWGMVVSDAEKQAITKKQPLGNKSTLESERIQFCNFARELGYDFETQDVREIPLNLWREYVRQTHAIRSGERIKKYFEIIDTGVALRLSRICESHYLDWEILRDPYKYPLHCSILGEVVNLRAITIYLRLIDMLDMADDRTPYAVWKFAAPRNLRSSMEWSKHRSIRRITFPRYQVSQRRILVDGSTNDHEVYAALEDLRDYCEKQFRGCMDLLAEMPDDQYALNLSHIEWRIEPEGFKPISVQFQFDRDKMFDIMGKELYQGDKYVFLRELLQNSIDAIRMRRAVIRSKEGRDPNEIGWIRVTVEHREDGITDITWRDDGIGMDEYIIQNYLAIVGRSYYHSDDFKRLGIAFEPISRFGIGILTCFMVTDSIEITTCKDRNLHPPSNPLRVKIPAFNRRFRVYTLSKENVSTGTIINLSINKNKILSENDDRDNVNPYWVTDYIRNIAGFVEFPISIEEGNRRTVILHPFKDTAEVRRQIGNDYEIVQLDLDYPWEKAVFSQDLSIARKVFRIETYNLREHLELNHYEGVLSYPVPVDVTTDFTDGLPGSRRVTVLSSNQPDLVGKSMRWISGWKSQLIRERLHGESSERCHSGTIYRDGILFSRVYFKLPAVTNIEYIETANASHLVVNLPKSLTADIDLSRMQVLTDSNLWAVPIFKAHARYLSKIFPKEFLKLTPAQRLFQLASFFIFHNVPLTILGQIIPEDEWPLPFLGKGGELKLTLWREIKTNPIYRSPDPLSDKLAHLMDNLFKSCNIPEPLNKWQGPPSLINFSTWGTGGESKIKAAITEFVRWPLGTSHNFAGIRFLSPPWSGNPPLLQEVWNPKENSDLHSINTDMKQIFEQISEDKGDIEVLVEPLFLQRLFEIIGLKGIDLRITNFPSPFNDSFAYGNDALNIRHPTVKTLIRLAAKAILLKMSGDEWGLQYSQLEYLIRDVLLGLPGGVGTHNYSEWEKSMSDLWILAKSMKSIDLMKIETLIPKLEEFVPGSFESFLSIKVRENWNEHFGKILE